MKKLWSVNPPFTGGREPAPPGAFLPMVRRIFSRFDPLQFVPLIVLVSAGLLFIYGTGQQIGFGAEHIWKRQLVYLGIGMGIWLFLTFFDYRWLGPASIVIYPLSLFFLILVLFIGIKRNEAARWLALGGITFQPSEFAKLAVLLAVSWILSFKKADINKILWAVLVFLTAAIPFGLIYLEPDLGTALVLFPAVGAIAFAANLKFRYIIIIMVILLSATPAIYMNLKPYQVERIKTFMDPERDPMDRGWNAIQAELSVGSGGLTGKGFMCGTHCMLGYLPQTVANSDFIFSVISEETGFLGTVSLLLLYACLLFSIYRTALLAPDPFGRNFCVGTGTILTVHVTVNMGMCLRLLPITGVPLPLISSGGTFLIVMMTYLGVVQSVYANRHRESFLEV
ncbi:MAG: rod shape-determining protein RodA [Lentisphaeria bacterium]|nr:rod shape-determining protein RodA [Lentisphaeria bacterium]